MGTSHILGSYTFEDNPEKMGIPEKTKTVSRVKTYNGSATFQWPAIIQGSLVIMFWTVISIEQYDAMRALYLSPDTVSWNPQYKGVYQVLVIKCEGKYIDGVLNHNPNRIDVELVLEIRSGPV